MFSPLRTRCISSSHCFTAVKPHTAPDLSPSFFDVNANSLYLSLFFAISPSIGLPCSGLEITFAGLGVAIAGLGVAAAGLEVTWAGLGGVASTSAGATSSLGVVTGKEANAGGISFSSMGFPVLILRCKSVKVANPRANLLALEVSPVSLHFFSATAYISSLVSITVSKLSPAH